MKNITGFWCLDGVAVVPRNTANLNNLLHRGRPDIGDLMGRLFVISRADLAENGCQVHSAWIVVTHELLTLACQLAGREVADLRLATVRDLAVARGAIRGREYKWKVLAWKRADIREPRSRRLELLRLIGIKRFGRVGTATKVHSEPPRWDGFGSAPFAYAIIPDDQRKPVQRRVNDRDQWDYIAGSDCDNLRAAFGTAGSRLSFERVTI